VSDRYDFFRVGERPSKRMEIFMAYKKIIR
jgi:hypothetical protein